MATDLKDLHIDRGDRGSFRRRKETRRLDRCRRGGRPAGRCGSVRAACSNAPSRWTVRVTATSAASAGPGVILNATGYIVAAHKIEVAAKVMGKVAWIGVEKGDRVKQGQVLVRLEDDEYRAPAEQAQGQLRQPGGAAGRVGGTARGRRRSRRPRPMSNQAASRPGERQASPWTAPAAGRREASCPPRRWTTRRPSTMPPLARVNSLDRRYELVKLGPRKEQIDAAARPGGAGQGRGGVYAKRNLDNTVIRAPVTGTILERAVEKGEFVTTGFVGDRGAKGYVVSLADLNDLEVELDISQNDFAKLGPAAARQRHHRRVPGPQVRRLHHGDLAGSEPAEGHRAGEGEGRESGRVPAAGDERQRGVLLGREAGGRLRRPPSSRCDRSPAVGGARRRGLRGARRQGRAPGGEDGRDEQPGRARRRGADRRRGPDRRIRRPA